MISEAEQNLTSSKRAESVEKPAEAREESAVHPKIEELLNERARLAALHEDINAALVRDSDLPAVLGRCARFLVNRLNAAAALIWTFNAEENTLELRAMAGAHLPPDEAYSRIPIGQRRIGMIAEKRLPCLVNDILKDAQFTPKKWIKREKIRAFAGYPLIVEKRLVGVMGIFARDRLPKLTLRATASVANAIAGGIKRKQSEEARRRLLEKLEKASESERRHLSRELHDDIAQQLVVALMKLQRAEERILKLLPDEHSVIADLVVAQELLLRNQQSLRLTAHTLHSEILEHFGLPEALRKFVADVKILATEKSTAISFDYPSGFPRLKLSVETDAYRIVQEAVSNALKYARAQSISLQLRIEGNVIFVVVKDDGDGFDLKEIRNAGIGLASMLERAELIGSKLSISSQIGKGTKISLKIPLEKNRRFKKV